MPPAFNLSQDQTLQFNLVLIIKLTDAKLAIYAVTQPPAFQPKTSTRLRNHPFGQLRLLHRVSTKVSCPPARFTPSRLLQLNEALLTEAPAPQYPHLSVANF